MGCTGSCWSSAITVRAWEVCSIGPTSVVACGAAHFYTIASLDSVHSWSTLHFTARCLPLARCPADNFAAALIDRRWYGRVRMQAVGFLMLFILFILCAALYDTLLSNTGAFQVRRCHGGGMPVARACSNVLQGPTQDCFAPGPRVPEFLWTAGACCTRFRANKLVTAHAPSDAPSLFAVPVSIRLFLEPARAQLHHVPDCQ